jgi:hypothetical protein
VKKFAFLLGVFLLMSPAVPLLADNHNGEDNSIPENLPVPAIIVEEPPEQIEDVACTY